jgi:uncharacterized membrane protein YphA (DoxX/SURF4 family)
MSEFISESKGYRPAIRLIPFICIYFGLRFIFSHRDKFRSSLPEPINIFNHAGNFASINVTILAILLIALPICLLTNLKKKTARTLTIFIGSATGLLVNILNETHFGQAITRLPNKVDPLDLLYGFVACFIFSCFSFKVKPKKFKV